MKIRSLLRRDNRSDPKHLPHTGKSIGDTPQLRVDMSQLSNVYKPHMVSLGPFYPLPDTKHYKNETVKSKLDHNRLNNLVDSMTQIDEFTSTIRQWYDSSEGWNGGSKFPNRSNCPRSNKDLCQMMALDGFFLLQFLRENSRRSLAAGTSTSLVCGRFQLLSQQLEVQKDIMRLFNQIPLFVLQIILKWEAGTENIEADTDQNLHSILKDAWINLSPIRYSWDSHMSLKEEWHLLQFVYENIISSSDFRNPNKRRKKNRNKQWKKKRDGSLSPLPTAVQLKEKGVSFAPLKNGLLQEIHFDYRTGTLYLPVIEMDGITDSVLRNLVEFEAASQKETNKPALMRYVDMMDRLINAANDVEVLKNDGVIHSHMGNDDDVANVWNRLREVVNKKGEYEPIDTAVDEVMAFYTSRCRNLYTEFKRSYCSRPWVIISVISGCILLVLTVLQTLLAWEQVRLQRKGMQPMAKM